jgi:hypothetical protein
VPVVPICQLTICTSVPNRIDMRYVRGNILDVMVALEILLLALEETPFDTDVHKCCIKKKLDFNMKLNKYA